MRETPGVPKTLVSRTLAEAKPRTISRPLFV